MTRELVTCDNNLSNEREKKCKLRHWYWVADGAGELLLFVLTQCHVRKMQNYHIDIGMMMTQVPTNTIIYARMRHSLKMKTGYFNLMQGRKQFNDTFNTFGLRLYGVGHMVNFHSSRDSCHSLQPLYGLLFVIQVRSECLTCTFRASCCSARLSRAQVPAFAGSYVRDRKKGGGSKGRPSALAGTREYEQSVEKIIAGGGCFDVL